MNAISVNDVHTSRSYCITGDYYQTNTVFESQTFVETLPVIIAWYLSSED